MSERDPGKKPSNKGKLRLAFEHPLETVARGIHHVLPELTPNQVTLTGLGLVAAGALASTRLDYEKTKKLSQTSIPLFLTAAGMVMDALDGSLARVIAKEDPTKHNSTIGQIVDAGSDRTQEAILGLVRMYQAHQRGDQVGKFFAFTSTISNAIPSLLRAGLEANGREAPEDGEGVWGLLGTRPVRAALNLTATNFPTVNGFPVQPVIDGISTVANSIVAEQRFNTLVHPSETDILASPQKVADAKLRLPFLGVMSGAIIGTAFVARHLMRRNN